MKNIFVYIFIISLTFFSCGNNHEEGKDNATDLNTLELINSVDFEVNKITRITLPITVDRIDGFYEILEYSADYKNLKLKENPSITMDDISHVIDVKQDVNLSVINIALTKDGSEKFYTLTKNNIDEAIPIVINKQIIFMPHVNEPISGGEVSISGNFTKVELDKLVDRFNHK